MAKRNWDKALYSKYALVSSPSQLTTYLDCPRKWWFKSVCRLPDGSDQKKFVFGSAFHDVVMRWLQSTEQRPVELFPAGWDDGLDAVESTSIRKLVETGIADGTLRRLPGMEVEKEYVSVVTPDVAMIGALDVVSPEGVEDHKTSKSKNYVASQKELASDAKMLCYAHEWLKAHPASNVKLRLNYFIKDPDNLSTRVVEVMVPAAGVADFWEKTAKPAHEGMLALKRARKPAEKWQEVTGPQTKETCRKYGGCPYAKICGRIQTPAAYMTQMNIFKKKAPAEPSASPPPPVIEKKPEPRASVAPWAVPECQACGGTGINKKKGSPCRACDSIRSRRGEATSDAFDPKVVDGQLTWTEDNIEASLPIVSEVETKPAKPPKKVEPKIKPAPEPEPEPKPKPKPEPKPEAFRLFINAVPFNQGFVDLAEVLETEGKTLATAWEAESYYDLDAFRRRDAIAKAAPEIAKNLSGQTVVAVGGSQDLKALVDALRPYAREVVHGTF